MSQKEFRNQCDGCRRGLPIVDGDHINPRTGWVFMHCTKDRYSKLIKIPLSIADVVDDVLIEVLGKESG